MFYFVPTILELTTGKEIRGNFLIPEKNKEEARKKAKKFISELDTNERRTICGGDKVEVLDVEVYSKDSEVILI